MINSVLDGFVHDYIVLWQQQSKNNLSNVVVDI